MGGPTVFGTCCSSSFVMDHQAGYTLCASAAEVLGVLIFFFLLVVCSVKDPVTLPGSIWFHRLQQLGLIWQILLWGQPYLVPCGWFPSCYRKVCAATHSVF